MTKNDITPKIKELIAADRLGEALQLMMDYTRDLDRSLENSLLMQMGAYNRNRKDFSNGLVSESSKNIANARLRHALTEMLSDLPARGNDVVLSVSDTDSTTNPSGSSGASGKRKILLLSANPSAEGRLQIDLEHRKIKDGLAAATYREAFELIYEPAVQISTITKAMQIIHPEIVHFSGHGKTIGLVVQGDGGQAELFPSFGLDRLFRRFKDQVKCVVLNACYSKDQAAIISQHNIHVVGVDDKISDVAATAFSVGFYQSIAEGKDFVYAFDIAMINISAHVNNQNTPELWLNGEIIMK